MELIKEESQMTQQVVNNRCDGIEEQNEKTQRFLCHMYADLTTQIQTIGSNQLYYPQRVIYIRSNEHNNFLNEIRNSQSNEFDTEEKIYQKINRWRNCAEFKDYYNSNDSEQIKIAYFVIVEIADYVKDALLRFG